MAAAFEASSGPVPPVSLWDRLRLRRPLALGYTGLLFFMIGDGVEAGFLAPLLLGHGISEGQVALMFTIYGMTATIASRYTGVICDAWGPRLGMAAGLFLWTVLEALFLMFGIGTGSYPMMLATYALRGFAYPLFAYGFLVWVVGVTPPRRLGSAVGWFWFAFTAGLPTLGSMFASFAIPLIGQYSTLWASLGFVVLGGVISLIGVSEGTGLFKFQKARARPLESLFSSISIIWKEPKTTIGAVVRMINTTPQFGFLVFLPTFFTATIGFSLSEWLRLLSYMFLSNIIWNLLMGMVGDKLGWRLTVAYVGGIGCAITTLLLYYIPTTFRGDYSLAVLVAVLYGAALAGYVPLSAIMPLLVPEQKGAAISLLSLGACMSTWLGPTIVAISIGRVGVVGVMWIFAIMYVISAILALFLTLPAEVEAAAVAAADRKGISGAALGAAGCLLGHPPAMTSFAGENDIDLLLFDLGGTIYDDETFTRAMLRAVHEINPKIQESDFWAVYDAERERSSGSLRTAIANRFVPGGDREKLTALARRYREYPASALYPDVKPTLYTLARKFKLGLVANSGEAALKALRRDRLHDLFSVIALSEIVGIEKPSEGIFRYALERANVPASRAVHIGNRLDNDIRPAQRLGLRTIWLLRGDAPPAPTLDQLAEPDAILTSLVGLPIALSRITTVNPVSHLPSEVS